MGRSACKHSVAVVASTACLAASSVLASCSATSAPPPGPLAQPSASSPSSAPASKAAPPSTAVPQAAQETSPLAKDWKKYGGTAFFGCPDEFNVSNSSLEDIRPKVFDPKTGQFTSPGVPTVADGEKVTGAMCALSNSVDDMKVVYLVTTSKPAQPPEPEVTKTTAYLFDLKSPQPLASKELQPPTPDLRLTTANQWRLGATRSGVAWVNAFTDGRAPAAPPRTVVLANTDLAMMWNDPQPGKVWQDVLAFQRNTAGKTTGAELRQPTGEPIHQDNDIASVDAELSDGPDKLVKITRWDAYSPPVMSTMFFDLNSKSIIKIGDADRISGDGVTATLSEGKLFIDARGSVNSTFGFGVWNLRTQQWDLLKNRDEATKMAIAKLTFFGGRLYVTYTGGTLSVIELPATQIATSWAVRPFGRITGWTLVCRGETATAAGGDCKEIVLVQDENGHYPGPWT
jgi:hypothetical protein